MATASPQLSTDAVDKVVDNRHVTAIVAPENLAFSPIAY
jgi:hypothetical protein